MAYEPYSAVARALQDLGSSVQSGFGQLGDARMSAADLELKKARQAHDIKKEEMLFPQMKLDRDNAVRELEVNKELEQPLDTNFAMSMTFNKNTKDHEFAHFFTNDIPGTFLSATGTKYDQENDRYIGADGKALTRRDFINAAPVYQSVIAAKTDVLKKAQDELEHAKKTGDNKKVVALTKFLDDKHNHLNAYDEQEQRLIEMKGRIQSQYGDRFNLTYIDDSIDRLKRKRNEVFLEMEADRKLAKENKRLSDQWKAEHKMKAAMEARKYAQDVMAQRLEQEGGIQVPVLDENGAPVMERKFPWVGGEEPAMRAATDAEIKKMEDDLASEYYLDVARAVNFTTDLTGAPIANRTSPAGKETKPKGQKYTDLVNQQDPKSTEPNKPLDTKPSPTKGGFWGRVIKALDKWEGATNAQIDQTIEDWKAGKVKGKTSTQIAEEMARKYGYKPKK